MPVGRCWTANVRQSSERPAIVLQVREHRRGLETLTPEEASEMGLAIHKVAQALMEQPGVDHVYAQSFNETAGGHVHAHLIPKFQGESAVGPLLARAPNIPTAFAIAAALRDLCMLP